MYVSLNVCKRTYDTGEISRQRKGIGSKKEQVVKYCIKMQRKVIFEKTKKLHPEAEARVLTRFLNTLVQF